MFVQLLPRRECPEMLQGMCPDAHALGSQHSLVGPHNMHETVAPEPGHALVILHKIKDQSHLIHMTPLLAQGVLALHGVMPLVLIVGRG